MPKPNWWYTLQESRRQALVGIDFYNAAGDKRSFLDFVVHMHLAWQNLLHADLMRRRVSTHYKDGNRYRKDKDGNRVTWELAKCVREEFKDNDPVRANVEFFIGLRNKIEHRYQEGLLLRTAAHAHALVLNYEAELIRRFGAEQSLADQLRFPVFIQSLTPEGMAEQRAVRRAVPASASTYITDFETNLDPTVRDDTRFEYRVLLTPVKGPPTGADMAVTFVNTKELSVEQLAAIQSATTGTVLVAEKQRSVGLKDEMLPGAAVRAIQAKIPFRFTQSEFLRVRRAMGVGPKKGQTQDAGDDRYCIYVAPSHQHVYTNAFVNKLIRELQSAARYEALAGHPPEPKEQSAA